MLAQRSAGPQSVMDKKSRTVAASDEIGSGYFGSRGLIFLIFFRGFAWFNGCTFPKGFSSASGVLVSSLSSVQHHMALAVLHSWCFPLPQSMYAW